MRILIVKLGAIGDVVMALPMIDAVRAADSKAQITWLCGESVRPLLEAHGGIDRIIALDDVRLLRGNLWQRLTSVLAAWRFVAGRTFDRIVTGHSDWRYRVLSWPARGRTRRSFGVRRGDRLPADGRWHAQEYVRLVTDAEPSQLASVRLPRLKPQLGPEFAAALTHDATRWVALAPGGARNILRDDALRRWPVERYGELAGRLVAAGYRVALTGGAGDEWVRESLGARDVVDWIGRTSLLDLIAVYGHCQLVITHDSGPLHLATLAGAPVLGLFGPTSPHEKVPPSGTVRVLWGGSDLACRPCYDGSSYAACTRNVCLEDLDVDAVYLAAQRILEAHA